MRTRSLLLAALVAALLALAAVPAGAAGPGDAVDLRRQRLRGAGRRHHHQPPHHPRPGPGLAGVETVTAGRACSAAL